MTHQHWFWLSFFCLASFSSRETLSFLSLRGEKPPTSWLEWLKQLRINVQVQSRLQTVSGQRLLETTVCTNFRLFRSFLLSEASGPKSEAESARIKSSVLLGRPCWSSFPEETLNKWGQRSNRIGLMHGKNVSEVPLWNATTLPRRKWPPSLRSRLGTALIMGNSIISLGRMEIP